MGEVASIEGSEEQREAGYYTMEGHNGAVTCLAMTTDATQMVSGGHLPVDSATHLVGPRSSACRRHGKVAASS